VIKALLNYQLVSGALAVAVALGRAVPARPAAVIPIGVKTRPRLRDIIHDHRSLPPQTPPKITPKTPIKLPRNDTAKNHPQNPIEVPGK